MVGTKKNDGFELVLKLVLILLGAAFVFPFWYVLSASLSSPVAIASSPILLYPKQFTLETYEIILRYSAVWKGYGNTILYTLTGTAINVCITLAAAYALTRKELAGRRIILFAIVLTMFLSAGLIPVYLLVRDLGLLNTRWAMVLPVAVATWNLFIARAYLQSNLPNELHEAAEVDGAGEYTYFFKIVVPLSKPIIVVLAFFYGAGHWDRFFEALIYLRNRDLYPLQLILREILIESQVQAEMQGEMLRDNFAVMGVKYGIIVVSVLPVLVVFPFAQRYFVKGVMIGSLKG